MLAFRGGRYGLVWILGMVLWLSGCSSSAVFDERQQLAEQAIVGVDFGPAPVNYQATVEQQLPGYVTITRPEFYALQMTRPLRWFEVDRHGQLTQAKWAVEVALPWYAIRSTLFSIDVTPTSPDYRPNWLWAGYALFEGERFVAFYEDLFIAKGMMGVYILDDSDQVVHPSKIGLLLADTKVVNNTHPITDKPAPAKAAANDPITPSATVPPSTLATQLRELKALQQDGVITQAEFEAKKKQLLQL
ncbi:SHOCT domain-containing protein [Ferrimonas senticii]|uniref:SHOCT domain-containing protein n=1 Tax=Ferrimonas senticii TaxID=394566 RepID=UPI00196A15E7|nr:SHOCT domain-containing protein [Ferrimonas senticii]